MVSDLLDPLAEAMYRDESVAELYRQLDPADMLYDYLIGSTIGLFGSGDGAGKNSLPRFEKQPPPCRALFRNILHPF